MTQELEYHNKMFFAYLHQLGVSLQDSDESKVRAALQNFDDLLAYENKLKTLRSITDNHEFIIGLWKKIRDAVDTADMSVLNQVENDIPQSGVRLFSGAIRDARKEIQSRLEAAAEEEKNDTFKLEIPDPSKLEQSEWKNELVLVRRILEDVIKTGFDEETADQVEDAIEVILTTISDAEMIYNVDLSILSNAFIRIREKLRFEDADEEATLVEVSEVEKAIEELAQKLLITDKTDAHYFNPLNVYRDGRNALDFIRNKKNYFQSVLAQELDTNVTDRKRKVLILQEFDELIVALEKRIEEIQKQRRETEIENEKTPAFESLEKQVALSIKGKTNYASEIVTLADTITACEKDLAKITTESAKTHYAAVLEKAKEFLSRLNAATLEYHVSRITIESGSNPDSVPEFVAVYTDLAQPVPGTAARLKRNIDDLSAHWDAVWDTESQRILVPLPVHQDTNGNTVFPTQELQDRYNKCNEIVVLRKKVEKKNKELKDKHEALTRKDKAREVIERKWLQILGTDKTTKEQTQNDARVNQPYNNGNIENAGIMALVREFFPTEEKMWELKIKLWNGFAKAANTDVFKQMGWIDTYDARKKWQGEADVDDLRKYVENAEIQPAFKYMEEIFAQPQTYMGTTGVMVTHDYAKDGNPNAGEVEAGAMTVAQLIKKKFPDLLSSDVDGLMFVALMGELRLKYHAKYHGAYMKSADGTFDTKPIELHAPLDAITYKIRAYGKIFPNHRLLWQILRMPKKTTGGIHTVTLKDALKHAYADHHFSLKPNRLEMLRDYRVDDKQSPGFGDEYVPVEVDADKKADPTQWDKAYRNHQVAEAAIVRGLEDRRLTSSWEDFTPVRMGEDKSLIPFWWDVAFHSKELGFNAITHAEFFSTCEMWKKFLDKAQNPAPITKMSDVNDRISDLVGALSPAKALFWLMPSGSEHGKRFRAVLCQIFLRFTKNIYDQFDRKAAYTITDRVAKAPTKRGYFYSVVTSEYENLGTLDGSIKKFILEQLKRNFGPTSHLQDNLFTRASGNPLPVGIKSRREVEELLEQYLKEPTEDEKK